MALHRMIGAALVACCLLAAAAPAVAQRLPDAATSDPAKDPERLAAARDLYLIAGGGKQLDGMIDTMFRGMAAQFARQQPGHAQEIHDVFQRMARKFRERKEELVAIVAPVYAAEFTAGEMRELIGFYSAGIGKRFMDAQPSITQKLLPQTMMWGQRLGEEAVEEARRELKKRGIDL